jgi:hypothetical protein
MLAKINAVEDRPCAEALVKLFAYVASAGGSSPLFSPVRSRYCMRLDSIEEWLATKEAAEPKEVTV